MLKASVGFFFRKEENNAELAAILDTFSALAFCSLAFFHCPYDHSAANTAITVTAKAPASRKRCFRTSLRRSSSRRNFLNLAIGRTSVSCESSYE